MPRTRPPAFPELEKQIMMHGLRKGDIADYLHISKAALSRKLTGQADFTWSEIKCLHAFFPDVPIEVLLGIESADR